MVWISSMWALVDEWYSSCVIYSCVLHPLCCRNPNDVGVVQLVFQALQLLPFTFTQQSGTCCISKIYDEASPKTGLKIEPALLYLCLFQVHVCWFINLVHRSSQLCQLLSVE